MEEWREEGNESVNVQPLECHKTNLSLTRSKEVHNWVRAAIVLSQPLFAYHGTETGTKARGEAGKPKAVDGDRKAGWFEGGGWVGNACQARVTAVQQLVKEQGRLLLVVRLKTAEGRDEECSDDR